MFIDFKLINPSESSFGGKLFYPPHTSGKQEAIWFSGAGCSLEQAGERRPGPQQSLTCWPMSIAGPRRGTHERLKWPHHKLREQLEF